MKTFNSYINEKLKLNSQSQLSSKEWTIEDAKDGDIITDNRKYNNSKLIYIFKKIEKELIFAYCYYDFEDKEFRKVDSENLGIRIFTGYKNRFDCWLSTEEEKEEFFEAAAKKGYIWDPIKKELKKI